MKRRTVETKAQVRERLKAVIDVANQIERLARKGHDMLSDLIEDISWSTGDCVIGKKREFDPPDYVYNVICQVWEGGLFKEKFNDPDAYEPYLAYLNELVRELEPRSRARASLKNDHYT